MFTTRVRLTDSRCKSGQALHERLAETPGCAMSRPWPRPSLMLRGQHKRQPDESGLGWRFDFYFGREAGVFVS